MDYVLTFGKGLRNTFKLHKLVNSMGNCGLGNITGKVGSVGFLSVLVPAAYPLQIIRIDPDTNEPIRNSSGYCEVVDYNEPGELIGKIIQIISLEIICII